MSIMGRRRQSEYKAKKKKAEASTKKAEKVAANAKPSKPTKGK